jgi:cyclopropane fatty-acyl-phospholipid synthase-like methyltransferase
MEARRRLVRDGYTAVAARFAALRRPGPEAPWIEALARELPPGARVLDLGCGTGEPIGTALAARGLRWTGVDFCEPLLRRARAALPGAPVVLADLVEVAFRTPRFAGAVSWDALFHVPRAEHAALFARIAAWLLPGAPFLLTLGGSAWEAVADHLGAPTFYSGHAPGRAVARLRGAGFAVERRVLDDPSSRGHLVVLARRR